MKKVGGPQTPPSGGQAREREGPEGGAEVGVEGILKFSP